MEHKAPDSLRKQLPIELLEEILSYVSNDLEALRRLSLSAPLLHIISQKYLFATMDFRSLSQPEHLPFRHFVTELRVVWGTDMFRVDQAELLQRSLIPYLNVKTLPRIRSLVVTSIGAEATTYLAAIGPKTLMPLHILNNLSLNHTTHRNLQDVQALICSFPYLDHLHLNGPSWNDDDDSEKRLPAIPLQPPSLKGLHLSAAYPTCTFQLAQWLGQSPSALSLLNLTIPFATGNASILLPLFGPSVQSLSVPMKGLQSEWPSKLISLAQPLIAAYAI